MTDKQTTFRVHFGDQSTKDFTATNAKEVRDLSEPMAKAMRTVVRKIKVVREGRANG